MSKSIEAAGALKKLTTIISKTPCPAQLAIGVVSGWSTGYITMKLGRPTAFTVGGGIIAIQVLQFTGLVKASWDDVTAKALTTTKRLPLVKDTPKIMSNMRVYARSNTCVAAGFVGGFLIGLAT